MANTEKFSNNAADSLNGGINSVVTSFTLNNGAAFPASGNFRVEIDSELILVGTRTGNVCSNCTRGIENTTAASHLNAAAVTHVLTAGALQVLPRSMSATGDIEYLAANAQPAALSAPADGNYALNFASGIPSYVSQGSLSGIPTGSLIMYGASSAPSGFVLCDGSAISRTTFSALFAVIGSTYGPGDGATTFNVPDLRQRMPLGKAASGTGSTLGSSGGAIDHTHTGATHNHGMSGNNSGANTSIESQGHVHGNITTGGDLTGGISADHTHTYTSPAGTTDNTTPGATGTNNPPYQVVNFIIKT